METLQHKSINGQIEVKEAREDGILSIRAYACVFGNVDSWNDIIVPTACDEFLNSKEADRMRLCWQHNMDDVIGRITAKGADGYGVWIEADILPTTLGKDVQTLVRGEAINELSIGYKIIRHHYDGDIRVLDEIIIREVSLVSIAANPLAVITDMKAEENEPEQTPAEMTEEKPINQETMDEMKKQLETIEQKAAAAEKKAADLAAQLEEKNNELKAAQTSIDNLDASVKSQQAAIEGMQAQMKDKKQESFVEAVKSVLEENKDKIEKLFEEKRGGSSIRMEVKAVTANTQAYGTAVDPVVGSAPHAARAFLAAFGEEVVNGDKAAWLDGTFTNNADYVDELTAAADSNAQADEVIRQFGKIATRVLLSSERADWMNEIASWAQGEAIEFINDKVDSEVWNGAGADTSAATKKKIYGLKGQATAFAKIGSYASANIADVILDAAAQVKKNGFVANVAIISFGSEAELKGVKDQNDNYLYNQLTGMLGGIRIYPSNTIGEKEIFVADSRCAKVLRRPSYELEITRDADLDGWKVNVRKAVQTKVKAAHKRGLIYVADKTAAITAITK